MPHGRRDSNWHKLSPAQGPYFFPASGPRRHQNESQMTPKCHLVLKKVAKRAPQSLKKHPQSGPNSKHRGTTRGLYKGANQQAQTKTPQKGSMR